MSSKGDRKKGAIVGAIVGAAAGNAIGQTLDEQAADLRRDLNNNQVNVTNTGSELIVTMPQENSTISIEGHTDNTGTANYNRILSQRRANAVADILVNNGVPPARLYAVGRGENEPVASNLSATGRAQNRRVEIVIRPNA